MIVSIIVLTYNAADTISQTLDSIIDQASLFGTEAEIIVGDDCSSDNTREILTEYKNKYPQLINLVFNSSNLRTVRNYFNLISYCKGKYIMECAGDDYWLPNKMNTQITFMEEHPEVGMCCSNAVKYYEDINKYELSGDNMVVPVDFDSLLRINNVYAVTVCIRKRIVDEYIMSVDPLSQNWLMEDYPFWLWISDNSLIKYINKPLCVYRVRRNSLSHSNNIDKEIDFLDSTISIRMFYAHNEADIRLIQKQMIEEKSRIYLKYNDRWKYRIAIKQSDCNKRTMKLFLSMFPGYTYIINYLQNRMSIRRSKKLASSLSECLLEESK